MHIGTTCKKHFCSYFLQTPPESHTANAYCCCLEVQRDSVNIMLSGLQYSIFNLQIVYKLYIAQLNCTYSNYTQAAATCSAAQQHSTFTVQILYKLYSVQLNCTYSSYTEAAATCSSAQLEGNCQADVFCSEVQTLVWNYNITHCQRLDPSNSRYWLQAQCLNLAVIRNKWMLQR